MRRRSNLMVLLGVVFFIVGAAIVYLVATNDEDNGATASGPDTVDVVVAKEALAQGALGDDLIADGKVEVKRVPAADKQADAITSPSQLSNQLLTASFAPGEQLRFGGLRARSLLSQAIDVPAGFEAVAIDLPFVEGGAGYIAPGDRVNVYAGLGLTDTQAAAFATNAATPTTLPYAVPRVELLLTNVLVLDVSQEIAPQRTQATTDTSTSPANARTGAQTITYLLALDTNDAEKVIFQQVVDGHLLYLTLTAKDAPPAGTTPGQDDSTILSEEPNAAFQRSNQ